MLNRFIPKREEDEEEDLYLDILDERKLLEELLIAAMTIESIRAILSRRKRLQEEIIDEQAEKVEVIEQKPIQNVVVNNSPLIEVDSKQQEKTKFVNSEIPQLDNELNRLAKSKKEYLTMLKLVNQLLSFFSGLNLKKDEYLDFFETIKEILRSSKSTNEVINNLNNLKLNAEAKYVEV